MYTSVLLSFGSSKLDAWKVNRARTGPPRASSARLASSTKRDMRPKRRSASKAVPERLIVRLATPGDATADELSVYSRG